MSKSQESTLFTVRMQWLNVIQSMLSASASSAYPSDVCHYIWQNAVQYFKNCKNMYLKIIFSKR